MGNPTCRSSDAEGLWYLPPHLKSRYFLRLSVLVRSVFRSCDLRLALMLSFSLHVFIVYRAFYPDCCCHWALGRMSEGHQPHLGVVASSSSLLLVGKFTRYDTRFMLSLIFAAVTYVPSLYCRSVSNGKNAFPLSQSGPGGRPPRPSRPEAATAVTEAGRPPVQGRRGTALCTGFCA